MWGWLPSPRGALGAAGDLMARWLPSPRDAVALVAARLPSMEWPARLFRLLLP